MPFFNCAGRVLWIIPPPEDSSDEALADLAGEAAASNRAGLMEVGWAAHLSCTPRWTDSYYLQGWQGWPRHPWLPYESKELTQLRICHSLIFILSTNR